MTLELDISWFLAVILIAIRIGVVFFSTPLYSFAPIPAKVKLVFILSLSLLLVLISGKGIVTSDFSLGAMVVSCMYELFLGAILAFAVNVAFAALQWGGRIIDMQIGFSVASLIDPATRTQSPLMGTLFSMFSLLVFYVVDGHHLLIRGLSYSVSAVPPGQVLSLHNPGIIIKQFGSLFTFGLMAVAPVVFSLTMIDLVIAVAAKTMPQMNVFFVGLPIKIFVGLLVFALTVRYVLPLLESIFSSMFGFWNKVLM